MHIFADLFWIAFTIWAQRDSEGGTTICFDFKKVTHGSMPMG
jgi:hypothetical protein